MSDDESQHRPEGDAADKPDRDLVFVGQRADTGYRVLRQRADRVEVGEIRELQKGKPLAGEVVRLHPTEVHDRLFECETLYQPEPPRTTGHKGPARVSTAAYRKQWERIFGADPAGTPRTPGSGHGSSDLN